MSKDKSISINWYEILYDSSRKTIDDAVILVEQNPKLLDSLLELVFSQSEKLSSRAARVICYFIEKYPNNYNDFTDKIIDITETIKNESIKFNLLKNFTYCQLPSDEDRLGILAKICFDAVEAKVERIAVKVYAVDILYRISQIYPDIKNELLPLLEKYMFDAKSAYISRASKVINKLKKDLGLKADTD